nr:filamentous hemagglutinin N-terminal domain-containing protein [Desulfobacula sp.]
MHLFILFPGLGHGKAHPFPAGPVCRRLPVLVPGQTQSGWSTTTDEAKHYLEVRQTEPKVVIEWQSFDIGSNAHTHFEQVQDGIALNRIFSSDPSRIFGKLTATGSIYLVNQNGILFGENSRVNLNSLVASSLNIKDEDFQNGLWKYNAENYMGDELYQGPGDVENRGTIETGSLGKIFLLAPHVENSGSLSAGNQGKILLSGGESYEWQSVTDSSGATRLVDKPDYKGEVVNSETGNMYADVADIGVYGKLVRHDGLIRSLSTVQKGASTQLVASQKLSTGENSRIDSLLKELDDPALTESFSPGRNLTLTAKPQNGETYDSWGIEHRGKIEFPSGDLTMDAGDGGYIYLAPESAIDVSGSWVTKAASDKILSIQANSLELRDEFQQKNGIIKGETLNILLNEGTEIGNISKKLSSRALSAGEQSLEGGTIDLKAGKGMVIVEHGAILDISGGGIQYEQGIVYTTKLVTAEGEVFDISEAPDWLTYTRLINAGDEKNPNYKTLLPGHTEGADAGSVNILARKVVFDPSLDASVSKGLFQVNTAELKDSLGYQKTIGARTPVPGSLKLGATFTTDEYNNNDPIVDSIVIKNRLPETGIHFSAGLPFSRKIKTEKPGCPMTCSAIPDWERWCFPPGKAWLPKQGPVSHLFPAEYSKAMPGNRSPGQYHCPFRGGGSGNPEQIQ